MQKKIKVLSLFSGIGSPEKGLKNLGVPHELVGFSEIDKNAIEAYCAIHGVDKSLNIGDITKLDETTLPDFDLMTYGFPCQAFSVAGKKLGFEDKEKGGLFFDSMRIARHKQPKFMIAENVKGLVIHDNGNTFKTILATLEDVGYNNYYKVCNSVDYGIPQARERIFIVSIRKDVDTGDFQFPDGKNKVTSMKDFIDFSINGRHRKKSIEPYFDPMFHKNYESKTGIIKVFDGVAQGYFTSSFSQNRIYSVEGVAPTLTTGYDTPLIYELGGLLTSKERYLLQGFTTQDFEKASQVCSERQLAKQAGNSITVNVIQAILEELLIK